MAKPVLQTKLIGQATHYSRHPLAPPELVYKVEEPPRRDYFSANQGLPSRREPPMPLVFYIVCVISWGFILARSFGLL